MSTINENNLITIDSAIPKGTPGVKVTDSSTGKSYYLPVLPESALKTDEELSAVWQGIDESSILPGTPCVRITRGDKSAVVPLLPWRELEPEPEPEPEPAGNLYSWEHSSSGWGEPILTMEGTFVDVKIGNEKIYALRNDGAVFIWGGEAGESWEQIDEGVTALVPYFGDIAFSRREDGLIEYLGFFWEGLFGEPREVVNNFIKKTGGGIIRDYPNGTTRQANFALWIVGEMASVDIGNPPNEFSGGNYLILGGDDLKDVVYYDSGQQIMIVTEAGRTYKYFVSNSKYTRDEYFTNYNAEGLLKNWPIHNDTDAGIFLATGESVTFLNSNYPFADRIKKNILLFEDRGNAYYVDLTDKFCVRTVEYIKDNSGNTIDIKPVFNYPIDGKWDCIVKTELKTDSLKNIYFGVKKI